MKSHEDDNKDKEDQTWPEKLNIYCNQLATRTFNTILHSLSGHVPFLPASQIMLSINNTAITHHIPSQIRHLWGQIAQQHYLTNQYFWEPHAFDTVHWEVFCKNLLSNMFNRHLFYIKWTNLLLPFNQKYHWFNICLSPQCPSRWQNKETEHHFLCCPNPERQHLKQQLINRTLFSTFCQHVILIIV